MRQKTIIDDGHPFWEIFLDVGHHEAAAMLYAAAQIQGLTQSLWAVVEELKKLDQPVPQEPCEDCNDEDEVCSHR